MSEKLHPNYPGTTHFDWTDGGLRLLELIKNKIKYMGGERALYYAMRHEARPVLMMPNKSVPRSDVSIVLNNWHKATAEDIALKLGKASCTVHRKVKKLGLGKNKTTSYGSGQQLKVQQWVLNTETGIYYENMVLASRVTNLKKRTFQQYLTGKRKNKTNFILLNK